jgi:hypothetical protein
MTAQEGVELAKALAWPATVLLLVVTLRQPITDLLRTIGQRTSKFKIFQFEFELGKLVPASANLLITVEALQRAVVQNSASALIVDVTRSATADYVLVALGADVDHAWLTSRLFSSLLFLTGTASFAAWSSPASEALSSVPHHPATCGG